MIVGEAFVEVHAVTNAVRKEIKQGFEKGAKGTGTETGQEIDKEMSKEVNKGTDKVTASMRRKFSRAGSDSGDQFGKEFTSKVVKHFENAGIKGKLLGALTSFIGPAAGLIGSLGGGLTALAAGITQAAGAAPILYNNLLSVVSVMGAVKLASSGVGKAIKDQLSGNTALFRKDMQRLSPAARDFVRYIKTIQPAIKSIRQTASENLFPGVERGIKGAMPLLPAFRREIGSLDRAVGNMVGNLGHLLGGPLRGQFTDILHNNTNVTKQFTRAMIPLADAFVRVEHEMAPVQLQFAKLVRRGAEWLDRTAKINQANGSMAKYFQRSFDRAKLLGSILHNVAATLRDIFHAADPSGQRMLKSIDATTARWAAFVRSTRGQNSLRSYFAGTVPVMHEVVGILGDAVKGMVSLGQNNNLLPLLQQIRTQLEPAIGRLLHSTTGPLASSLVTLASDLANIIATVANSGGSGYIQAFVSTLDNMAKALSAILSIPGLGTVAGTLLGIAGAVSAVGAVAGKLKLLSLLQGIMFPKGGGAGTLGKSAGGGVLGKVLGSGASALKPTPVYVTNWAEIAAGGGGGIPGVPGGKVGKEVDKGIEEGVKLGLAARIAAKVKGIFASGAARGVGKGLTVIGLADLIAEAVGPKLGHSGGFTTAFHIGQASSMVGPFNKMFSESFRDTLNPRQQRAIDRLRGPAQLALNQFNTTNDPRAIAAILVKANAALVKYQTTYNQGLRNIQRLLHIHIDQIRSTGLAHNVAAKVTQDAVTKQERLLSDLDARTDGVGRKFKGVTDVIGAMFGKVEAQAGVASRQLQLVGASLIDGFKGGPVATKLLGEQLIQGLINGMKAKTPAAKFQAHLTTSAIMKQIHLSGQYGSPSRYTFKRGQWTVDGLIRGMQSRMRQARHASQALAAVIHGNLGGPASLGALGRMSGGTGGSMTDELRALRMDVLKMVSAHERLARSVDSVPHGIVREQARRGGHQWRSAELLAS